MSGTYKTACLIIILLVAAVGLVLSDVSSHEFVAWDDGINYFSNPLLDPVRPKTFVQVWAAPINKTYRPVTNTLILLTAAATRLAQPIATPAGTESRVDPRAFHLLSLAFHLLNIVLVFLLLRLLVSNQWAAAAGALLYGVHPLQVEAVAWASGLSDVLKGTFVLLALWQYLLYARACESAGRETRHRGRWHYGAAFISYVLGLLCHPAVAVTAPLAGALDHWIVGRSWRRCIAPLAPWVLAALPIVAMADRSESLAAAQFGVAPILQTHAPPLFDRLFVAGDALAFYLGKLLWPVNLAVDYGRSPQWLLQQPWGRLDWLIPVAVIVAAVAMRRRHPWFMAAAAWAVVALAPNLGLVPFRFQYHSTVADRYAYVAMLAPALCLARALDLWNVAAVRVASVAVLFLLAFRCATQTIVWTDDLTLFSNDIAVNSRSVPGHNNLGAALMLRGLANGDKTQIADAVQQLNTATTLQPDLEVAHLMLGVCYAFQHNLPAADAEYKTARRLTPSDLQAGYGLASVLERQAKTSQAAALYREILRRDPTQATAAERLRQIDSAASPMSRRQR